MSVAKLRLRKTSVAHTFQACHADLLLLPTNAETVSHHVKASKNGNALARGPSDLHIL